MKPIKLTMYGFMTYKEKTQIDFRKLYPSRIFVISGDTGSGKTSIFDAISFALFGEISRPGVSQADLRCDFLSEEDPPTFVNYVFEVDGKVYEIERKPIQLAKKKVRAGVKIGHEVEVFEIKGDSRKLLSDKVTESNKLIKDIVGLDQNQLKKVMLLAQGQFSEFLSADSASKADLLSDIFQTSQYGKIQEDLNEMAKSYGKDLENLDLRLEEVLKKDQNLYDSIDQATKYRHDFGQIRQSLGSFQKNKEAKIKDLRSDQEKINQERDDLIDKLAKLDQENKQILLYKDLENEKSSMDKDLPVYETLKEDLSRAKNAYSIKPYHERVEEIREEIARIGLEIKAKEEMEAKIQEEHKTLEKKKEGLQDLAVQVDKEKIDLNSYREKERSLAKFLTIKSSYEKFYKEKLRLRDLEKSLNLEKSQEAEIANKLLGLSQEKLEKNSQNSSLILEKLDLEKALEKNSDLTTKAKANLALKDQVKSLKSDLKDLEKNLSQAKKDLDQGLKNADILEKQKYIRILNESHVCPICGTEHEETFPEVEDLDLDLETLRETYHGLQTQRDLGEKEIGLLQKNILEGLPSLEDLVYEREELEQKLKSTGEKLNLCQADLQKLELRIKDLTYEKSKKEKSIKSLEEEGQNLKNDLVDFDQVESSYLAMRESFEDLDYDLIKEKISALTQSIMEKEETIDKINHAYSQSDKKLTQIESFLQTNRSNLLVQEKSYSENKKILDTKISQYFSSREEFLQTLPTYEVLVSREKEMEEFFDRYKAVAIKLETLASYKDRNLVDLKSFREKVESLSQRLETLSEALTKENIGLASLNDIGDALISIEKSYQEKASDSQTIKRLAKIASGADGAIKGREKLDFETFVLIYYFEKILAYSNKRLLSMSDGQYRMVRKISGGDMRSKQGLDIEIIDANTGKARPASTLSGGETFLASLSLALGLSDEISAEHGGIKIDTLFIDEGFGSLSDNYLDNAISTIEILSYENKFIGLISHVKEVKDAIDAKILVKYDKSQGSEVEIII